MGYPGRTYRHLPSFAIEADQLKRYPFQIQTARDLIQIFEDFSARNEKAAVKLSSQIKGLNNVLKNNQGMLEGLIKTKLLEKKRAEEKNYLQFLKKNPEWQKEYGSLLNEIKSLYKDQARIREKSLLFRWIRYGSSMFSYALTINKWSIERQKNDIEREPGYQERDLPNIELRLKVGQRSLVPEADKAALEYFLKKALALPEGQKVQAVERIVNQHPEIPANKAIHEFLKTIYKKTGLNSAEERVKMLHLSREELLKRSDPFLAFADAWDKEREVLRRKEKEFSGALSRLMPRFLKGFSEWKKIVLYPDANGTLRMNFGKVKGYSPRDAVWYHYLTSLSGVVEKHTGKEPFDNPERLLSVYREKDFGPYVDKNISDVPVNFLTTNDSTGGNSGSPVLNAKGELVGLLFDGNYEAMYSDYVFDPDLTRSINVDIRYVLFIAEKVDKAFRVLEELTVQ
ncbi:MAG: S46 family peptidase, partial [Candidatus Aminicenantales bacterium]